MSRDYDEAHDPRYYDVINGRRVRIKAREDTAMDEQNIKCMVASYVASYVADAIQAAKAEWRESLELSLTVDHYESTMTVTLSDSDGDICSGNVYSSVFLD